MNVKVKEAELMAKGLHWRDVARLEKRVETLEAALRMIDLEHLRLLATWLDITDREKDGDEVQDELRRWADSISAALAEELTGD